MNGGKILVVEDSAAYAQELCQTLAEDFGEKDLTTMLLVDEALEKIATRDFMDDVTFALVDLELRGGASSGPGDYDGRDKILHSLRKFAPWVPVVLVSRYLTGDPDKVLGEVTPYAFDAVLPKSYFANRRTYVKQWNELKKIVGASRIASLTGRDTQTILHLLEQDMEIECGRGAEQELEKYDRRNLESVFKTMGFNAEHLILDEVVQGFSGLSVVKATCQRGGTRVGWLLKFGSSVGKLNREVAAHRMMFVEGLTRGVSVPLLWWTPVVWGSVGMIAYEFAEDASTLLDVILNEGLESGLAKGAPAWGRLYEATVQNQVLPRKAISDAMSKAPEFLNSDTLKMEEVDPDRSMVVLVGAQHGDLHARNILVRSNGPVLIDFAHYRSSAERAIPLLDIAKLLVDLWAFTDEVELQDLVSGKFLETYSGSEIWAGVLGDNRATKDEVALFRLGVLAQLEVYSEYEDVDTTKRTDAERVLKIF